MGEKRHLIFALITLVLYDFSITDIYFKIILFKLNRTYSNYEGKTYCSDYSLMSSALASDECQLMLPLKKIIEKTIENT